RFQTCAPGHTFCIGPVTVTPVALTHSRPTLGWVIDCGGRRLAYLSDTRGLPEDSFATLAVAPVDLCVLDCAYPNGTNGPRGHNDLAEATAILNRMAPEIARLTHVNHELDGAAEAAPPDAPFARDGEIFTLAPDHQRLG
ncbi:MAG: MBL fold metallo-hydrolase, partial [Paracoccaceae bacterium]|nr:MBL fold metallo-hydrolase [Paracoccaceae bacterium]